MKDVKDVIKEINSYMTDEYGGATISNSSLRIAIKALESQEANGCEGCKYINKDEFELPCLICKRSKMDYWRN